MRLFIAINFNSEVTEHLNQVIKVLKKEAIRGNFTRVENIHLTLAFLGEVSKKRVPEIIHIMDVIAADKKAFELKIDGLGQFKNRTESLYWCGIQKN